MDKVECFKDWRCLLEWLVSLIALIDRIWDFQIMASSVALMPPPTALNTVCAATVSS